MREDLYVRLLIPQNNDCIQRLRATAAIPLMLRTPKIKEEASEAAELLATIDLSHTIPSQGNPAPVLPPFPYPVPPSSHRHFFLPIGDRNHSFVKVALEYPTASSPSTNTPITVTLKCQAAHPRRITSIALTVGVPGNEVVMVLPRGIITLGPMTDLHVTRKVLDDAKTQSVATGQLNLSLLPLKLDANTKSDNTRTHHFEESSSLTQQTQMTIMGLALHQRVDWNIVENTGSGGGLQGEIPGMKFELKDPVPCEFEFGCRVTETGQTEPHYGTFPATPMWWDFLSNFFSSELSTLLSPTKSLFSL